MSAQDLQITLVGKDVSASDSLRALARAANTAAKSAGDSLDQMNRRVQTSSEQSSRTVTSGFGSSLMGWAQTGLAGILGGIAASTTSAVMGAVSNAGQAVMSQLKSSVIDYNSQLENATIGFTTMMGSGKAATAFLDTLQAFATRTPFQFGDLTQYAQQMIGYGIKSKDVIKDLTALGDAASGAGRLDTLPNAVLAFNQMAARGKVDLGDLNQLTNAGIPAQAILADKYGVSRGALMKMISAGKLASSDALPKLIAGIEHGTKSSAAFGGMMDKQSGTFAGAMSNIKDAMDRTLSTAFRPFFKNLEQGANTVARFAGSKQLTTWANSTGKLVGSAMKTIGNAIQQVFGDPKVQASVGKLGQSLGNAFKAVGPAVAQILPNLVKFGQAVLPAIIDALTGVVDKIPTLLAWWARLSAGLAKAGPAIAGTIRFLADLGGTLFNVSAAIGNFVATAVGGFARFVSQSQGRLNGLVSWMGGLVGQFAAIGGYIVSGFLGGIQGAWGAVTSTVQNLVNAIPLAVRKLLGIASPSKVFKQLGAWVGEGLNQGLLGSMSQVSASASSMASAVRDAFANKQIGKAAEQAGLADIKAMTNANSRLAILGKQRTAVLARESALKSSRSGVYNDVTGATRGYGNITGFSAPGDAVQGLQALVTKTKTFTSDLKSLTRKGVSGTMLSQLVDGWNSDPDSALATANGLLANPTDLKQILSLNKQLASAGAGLGSYAAHSEYDSQINAAAGKSKVLTWEMQKAAQQGLRKAAGDIHIYLPANGIYVGTKEQIGKTITQLIRDEVKKGAIPKNWNNG